MKPRPIGDHQYRISFELASNEEDLLTWNVEAKIGPISYFPPYRNPGVVVRGYFSLADLTIVSRAYEPGVAEDSPEVAELHSRIVAENPEIQRFIKRHLLEPFRFKANSSGIEADRFFQGQGNRFYLQLHEHDRYKFLTAEKTY